MHEPTLSLAVPPEALQPLLQRVKELVLADLAITCDEASARSPWFTVSEAAEYLRCKPQRIRDLLAQRKLTRYKENGRTLLHRDELEALVTLEAVALAGVCAA